MSKLDTVLNKLKKDNESSFSDVKTAGTIKRVLLESPRLNYSFSGGFGMGRIYEFSGPESSGKTTLALYVGGELQKKAERNMVVFVDMERSFDEAYANRLGLSTDTEKDFIFLRPENGEDGMVLVADLIKSLPVGLVIWDSVAVTPSRSQTEDAFKACVSPNTEVEFRVLD